METISDLERVLSNIVNVLVDSPEVARISTVANGSGVLFVIKVSKEDMGKVIGKDGRTAHSLRLLFHAFASKLKMQISLDISENVN